MNEDSRREPGLFDLPLEAPPPEAPLPEAAAPAIPETEPPAPSQEPRRHRRRERGGWTLPLFSENEIDEHLAETLPEARPLPREAARPVGPVAVPAPTPLPPAAGLGARLRGAAADLTVLAAVGVLAGFGADSLAAPVGPSQAMPLLLFVLAFSFVYFVIPLAFWGSTPGMSWAGLVARTRESEPLSFGQTAVRWLATWLTWALAGLPGLLALTGRSFADRLSGSSTFAVEPRDATG